MTDRAKTVSEYLKRLEPERRKVVQSLRTLVKKSVPGLRETMEYGMPTYRLDGRPFASVAAQKRYYALYLMDDRMIRKHLGDLPGLDLGKCCIRFRRPEALPGARVARLLQEAARSGGALCGAGEPPERKRARTKR